MTRNHVRDLWTPGRLSTLYTFEMKYNILTWPHFSASKTRGNGSKQRIVHISTGSAHIKAYRQMLYWLFYRYHMDIKIAVLQTNSNRNSKREQFITIVLKYHIYIFIYIYTPEQIPYVVWKLACIFIPMKRWNNGDSLPIEAYDKIGTEDSHCQTIERRNYATTTTQSTCVDFEVLYILQWLYWPLLKEYTCCSPVLNDVTIWKDWKTRIFSINLVYNLSSRFIVTTMETPEAWMRVH